MLIIDEIGMINSKLPDILILLLNGARQIMRNLDSNSTGYCCFHCSRGQSEFHFFQASPYLYLMADNECYQYSRYLN